MQPQPVPDRVIEQAIAGDAGARDLLIRGYGPRVYGLCRRLAADPDDAYQEIWIKVLGSLPRFDPGGAAPIGGWICTVARRHLIDRHRRVKARGEVVPLTRLPPVDSGVDERIAQRQRSARLEVALKRLPAAQRQVVVLHHIEGMSLEEIAAQEGCAVGTLKSRLHRGRAALMALMRGRT